MSFSVLSDDDLVNIFIKLPAKTLLCLKCVCKLWYTIITSPDFIRLHYDQSNLHIILRTPTLHLCDFDSFDFVTKINYPFKDSDKDVRAGFIRDVPFELVGSCRGLLYFSMIYYPFTSFLYNPTTQSHKFLPYLPWRCSSFRKIYFGLGYDSVNDYKCVRIILGDSKDKLGSFKSQVMVYSLRDDCWRPGAHNVPSYVLSLDLYFMYFNGFLHKLNFENYNNLKNTPRNIICLDVNNESFSSLALPNFHSGANTDFLIGVLDDCLCLTTFNRFGQYSEFWVMNEYGVEASWAMKYRLMELNMCDIRRPISFFKSTNKLFLAFGSKIVYKDLETSESRDVLSNEVYVNEYLWLVYADVCPENLLKLKDDVVDEPADDGEQRGENRNREWLIRETRRVLFNLVIESIHGW